MNTSFWLYKCWLYLWEVKVRSLSPVRLFAAPWTIACQAPPSVGFSRHEYWRGLPSPSLGDLPNAGVKPGAPAFQTDALPSEPPGKLPLRTSHQKSQISKCMRKEFLDLSVFGAQKGHRFPGGIFYTMKNMLEPGPRENDIKETMKKASWIPLGEKPNSSGQSSSSERTGHFQWETSYPFWYSGLYLSSSPSLRQLSGSSHCLHCLLACKVWAEKPEEDSRAIGTADTFIPSWLVQRPEQHPHLIDAAAVSSMHAAFSPLMADPADTAVMQQSGHHFQVEAIYLDSIK